MPFLFSDFRNTISLWVQISSENIHEESDFTPEIFSSFFLATFIVDKLVLFIAITYQIVEDVIQFGEHLESFEWRQKKSSNDYKFFAGCNDNGKNSAVMLAEQPKRLPTKLQINKESCNFSKFKND